MRALNESESVYVCVCVFERIRRTGLCALFIAKAALSKTEVRAATSQKPWDISKRSGRRTVTRAKAKSERGVFSKTLVCSALNCGVGLVPLSNYPRPNLHVRRPVMQASIDTQLTCCMSGLTFFAI